MKAVVEGRTSEVVAADLPEEEWVDLKTEHQRVRHRMKSSLCRCTDCGYPLHPKQRGLTRFFAHNPDPDNPCPHRAAEQNETPDHRNLKLAIYKAVREEPGWTAKVEVIGPENDPVTKRPVIVDVTAERHRGQVLPNWTEPIQGWEVQVSPQDDGLTLERQEQRMHWLGRCTWVTRKDRPSWADRVPWYQVKQAEGAEVLVDGVGRWDQIVGEYVNEEPFPAELMVRYILRGALWTDETGWLLEYAGEPRSRRRRASASAGSAVASYCERLKRLPEYAQGWTEEDWRRYAPLAHDRRRRGEPLTDLDEVAISRCPVLASALDSPVLGPLAPCELRDSGRVRPCIQCHQPVVISVAVDYPLHHHCAWHLQRGDECFA